MKKITVLMLLMLMSVSVAFARKSDSPVKELLERIDAGLSKKIDVVISPPARITLS